MKQITKNRISATLYTFSNTEKRERKTNEKIVRPIPGNLC